MERCINRFRLQNSARVVGSHGISTQIVKVRDLSASLGLPLNRAGLQQNLLRLGCGSIVPFNQKRETDESLRLSFWQLRCASDAQQLVEVGDSTLKTEPPVLVENGLELVEQEILEASLRRDPVSDELKGPGQLESGPSSNGNVHGSKLSEKVENGSKNRAGTTHPAVRECVQIGKHMEMEREISNIGCLPVVNGPEGGEVEVKGIWQQIKDIVMFAGPALGIWLSNPSMSLIDTAVVGSSSSMELAALGPGTVMCDQLGYIFMFLSIATSNLIASSLANKDRTSAEKHLSRLLLVAMTCGIGMFFFIQLCGTSMLKAFVGVKNYALVPAARSYVGIRGYAWPAVLVGMVAQSASLGMQDSWGPLKVLAITSLIKVFGDIFLCKFLGCGIVGAAWATTISQSIAALLMLRSLHRKGYNPFAIIIPSIGELMKIIQIAGPVLLTMMSKMAFYTFITYLATSLGAVTLAAHQVMIGVYSLCTVSGEPLSQTALSFMPEFIYGVNRNIKKAQKLLESLIIIGTIFGLSLGFLSSTIPWFFPQLFTRDAAIIKQMQGITLPFFLSLIITPPTLSLEGTLLATRDLKYLSFSMVSCFCGGCILLLWFPNVEPLQEMGFGQASEFRLHICLNLFEDRNLLKLLNNFGFGLVGSWWTLVAFQWGRFALALLRVASPKSVMMEGFSWSKSEMHFKTI